MGGTINQLQYDSEVSYSDQIRIRIGVGEGDTILKSISSESVYQLSNNGSWYAGAQYETQSGGATATIMTDNAAHSQWYTDYETVYNSSFAANGTAVSSEGTVHAKDGNTYVSDMDANGNTVASATFNTNSGKLVSSNNFAAPIIYAGDKTSSNALAFWFQPGYLNPDGSISPNPPIQSSPSSMSAGQSTNSSQTGNAPLINSGNLGGTGTAINLSDLHDQLQKDFQSIAKLEPTFAAAYDNTGTLKSAATTRVENYVLTPAHSDSNNLGNSHHVVFNPLIHTT